MPRGTTKKIQLSDQLILNQFMLRLFEVEDFEHLTKDMKDSSLEELDIDNVSQFYKQLTMKLVEREELSNDILRQYDENIVSHTLTISEKREKKIRWKYFQYLSLLFTEIYLDRYFNHREKLLNDLNAFIDVFNEDKSKGEQLNYYNVTDLKKLAFWNSTGSGKTLLMHVNILQYKHYFYNKHRRNELEQVILLTPSEDLSKQHLREFEVSGLQAALFDKNMQGLFRGNEISIIDIHKLKDEMGEKTVAIDAFEGNNLVLVDEGHRGSSGDEWRNKREKLSEQGFAFEYSATFGQAVSGNKKLMDEYSKCILFDYSYRYFYSDGYGKDYRILNLQDDEDEHIRHLYLTACLTAFYQQLKLYSENEVAYRPFMVAKPLWVFVGGSVNALRTQNKRKVSDVTDILLFIARFVKDSKEGISMIERLLSGQPGLLDGKGSEIFGNSFPYLLDKQMSAEEVYREILLIVFNSTLSNATLRVENLKGVDGEIALRIGDHEPFGVINVGDSNELSKLCATYTELLVTDRDFSKSYFHEIDKKDSGINILIGSKKFTEGWSSWRVSTMGLMNLGRSEGSQIIQLFGRGVRLKGYDFSLKRSEALKGEVPDIPKYLNFIETLNIFGIRADYMQQFKEYLEDEGIQTETDYEEIRLPVLKDYHKRKLKLKVLRLKDGIDFKKQGPKPKFSAPSERLSSNDKIIVNWYPKLQIHDSRIKRLSVRETQSITLNKEAFSEKHIAFMDMDHIYYEMQKFKNERSWYNLSLSKEEIIKLLSNDYWYEIEIPKEELVFDSFNKVKRWEEIALVLLKKYCEKQYLYAKKEWEAPHLEYYELTESDSNFFDEYKVSVDTSDTSMITKLKQLKDALKKSMLSDIEFGGLTSFSFSQHLYQPLITLEGAAIKVSPVPLNEGEYRFVQDLKTHYERNKDFFKDKELYLLRNQSRGRGIGFFEAGGFYPDFIIWIIHGEKQYITFADPKGIRNLSITDAKLQFYRHIKEMEHRLNDKDVILNAFTIANTYYSDLITTGLKLSKEQMEEQHILFQNDDRETYIDKMIKSILNENTITS
ncbi:DEAD/DEAH box helicase family protein [Cytobacillus sp. NCCP-133]|uniref:DEAD/DEAH box helicase family protein n=1 Tax=Cytobacillus sp. NCCP-133 TaxID=766848 RepID=UPI002231BA39|nr:DEAD/DEAH box helicase family protein [Cytobacillus sp. NCCP-133]GLB59188.1 type III restriction endonuclease subunit R [Cytobacillus sp. NCCP-133]